MDHALVAVSCAHQLGVVLRDGGGDDHLRVRRHLIAVMAHGGLDARSPQALHI